ncbi:TlpA family protein disulfide reductase [Dyella silvae]|uniref:TlpA family protein disulfide reductase n=1 Tax=Dyella silvae TaxID=2994424 RepID=UPI002264035B|nr:TlpA disulfide reductase family protein [Dyella silvae]
MRRTVLLGCLLTLALMAPLHAASADDGEQRFAASLHLGASPQLRYLDAAGKPLDYPAFAQQLGEGRSFSITKDSQAHAALLRLRAPGATEGQPGRFSFKRGDAFPPFELPSLQGGVRRLSDFNGRYTLVSFFFADCAPCIAEVPTLNAYAREHGDMNFVAITYEDAATAQRFVSERGLTWRVLHDGTALTDTIGVGIYPTLMLIDPSGHVAGAAVGMSMRDEPSKRLTDLTIWVEQWKATSTSR